MASQLIGITETGWFNPCGTAGRHQEAGIIVDDDKLFVYSRTRSIFNLPGEVYHENRNQKSLYP